MSHLPETPENEENDEMAFMNYFRSGMSWQQLLLYIYKHNKIIFKRSSFRDHFDEKEIGKDFLSPKLEEDQSYFGWEETKETRQNRESFISNDQTRK